MTRQLYYFNPGHEAAILNGSPYYMMPANVATMQRDLTFLPAWLANSDDYVWVDVSFPTDFGKHIKNMQISIAQPVTPTLLQTISSDISVHLWGISPQATHYFNEINTQYKLNLQIPEWDDSLQLLSSRQTAQECLIELCDSIDGLSQSIIPQFYNRLEDIELSVKESEYQLLAKAPFSSSGRGLLWLPIGELTRTERQILHGILKKQKTVSIEKVLNKKLDFAMEFSINQEDNIIFEGYSLFNTNSKGAYLGNYLDSQRNIEDIISSHINIDLLYQTQEVLKQTLKSKFKGVYKGCIGVDMMIYEENGERMLHPCVEINVRDNMGLLAICLKENHIAQESKGFFYIDFSTKENELLEKDREMNKLYPLIVSGGRIVSGYLSLCPILKDTRYRAYTLIDKT